MALDLRIARIAIEIKNEMKAHTGSIFDGGDFYCRHGVNLGNWAGPDYMCGACEDGVDDYTYALTCAYARVRRQQERATNQAMRDICDAIVYNKVMTGEYANHLIRDLLAPM